MDNELFVGDSASEPTNSVPTAAALKGHNLMLNDIPFCISGKTCLLSLGFVSKNKKTGDPVFNVQSGIIPDLR